MQVEGAKVHYQFSGSGSPLLLLHGLVGSGRNWRRNIGFLSRYASVYALDLFNMGESERVPGLDAGLEATADRIVALMDALDLGWADIAAHSHGGAIAMMLAARHPESGAKLILFAPANPFCDAGRQLIRFYNTSSWGAVCPQGAYTAAAAPCDGAGSHVWRSQAGGGRHSLRRIRRGCGSRGRSIMCCRSCARWYDDMRVLQAALGKLAGKPVLFIWGDRDRAVLLPSGRLLHQMMPQIQAGGDPGGRAPAVRGASRAVQHVRDHH